MNPQTGAEPVGVPRIILFTGKGGVGKSTIAAGTAAIAASRGHRTLVMSTDAAHSLADSMQVVLGSEPTQVEPNLWVHQVDAQRRFEESWADIQRYLLSVLETVGVDRVAAEELTVIPGAEEVLALLELRLHALSQRWDTIIVDCAPTAETLRLLALPEALNWYMDRVLPAERRIVRTLRPVLTRATGVPMPADTVFDAIENLHAELEDVRRLLTGTSASVRLVMTPESVVLAEARRSWTTLSLYGYRADGVVANRVFPTDDPDPWRERWIAAQSAVLAQARESFAPLPIWNSIYQWGEPVGVTRLREVATAAYGEFDPLAPATVPGPFRLVRRDKVAVLHLAVPGADPEALNLVRRGDELVVTYSAYRRILTLPPQLDRHRVAAARVRDGELQVRFEEETDER